MRKQILFFFVGLNILAPFAFAKVSSSKAEALSGSALLFPASYEQSRARFIDFCRQNATQGALCESFPVPSHNQEDLTIDSALFSRRGNHKLLILTSGVHGAEAFAGSAIQEWVSRQHLSRFLAKGTDVLMIHALNPYGFKHNRRVTENNINLNRNFTDDGRIFSIQNASYAKLSPILEPQGPVTHQVTASLDVSLKLIGDYISAGFNAQDMIVSIGQGQYTSPMGLEYGGAGIEPNVAILRATEAKIVPNYSDVLALDLHTGLGEQQTLHIMPGNFPDPESIEREKKILSFDAKKDAIVFTTGSDAGFYETHGDIDDLLPVLPNVPRGSHMMTLTLEFGTVGNSILAKLKTINRLILENQGAHYGFASKSVEKRVEQSFAELFNPSEVQWQNQVMDKAEKVLEAVEARF